MPSHFSVLSDLGNFRHNVQCNICGHTFVHRSGHENSVALSDTQTSPVCPVCRTQDTLPAASVHTQMTPVDALGKFGIVVVPTHPESKKSREPWEVYDFSMRQHHAKTQETCIERGKEWLEQDIASNDYGDEMTDEQKSALKVLFGEEKAATLIAMCHPFPQQE